MTAYKMNGDKSVIRGDGVGIPFDPLNKDYAQYLDWLALGNTPQPADQIPASVPSVTPWQFRKALNASGLRASVDTAIQSAPQDIKDGYEFATEYRADDAVLLSMASKLGLTAQQIADFFNLAKTL